MKLLINTTSPYTRILHIALWGKGLSEVETRVVDPWGDTPELLYANTAARVPTLVTDDGAGADREPADRPPMCVRTRCSAYPTR
jgi:glutathione S-transferase